PLDSIVCLWSNIRGTAHFRDGADSRERKEDAMLKAWRGGRAPSTPLEEHGETLEEAVLHDYSTSRQGIVPLGKRKPIWHFAAIRFTLEAGFAYIFLGFTLNQAGFTLPATAGILCGGAAFYIAYGAFAGYLGSRTGQTHALLSRSIFGVAGSVIVSALIIFT